MLYQLLNNLLICTNITTKDVHKGGSVMDKVSHALSTSNSGFGGGMGSMAKTCGAVTEAFMVVGLKYSQTQNDDKAAKNIRPRERICLFFAK
jgi:hypothetical protein